MSRSRVAPRVSAPEPPVPWTARAARAYGLADAREYGWPVWVLALGQVVAAVGRGVAVPFITIYLTRVLGIPLALVGLGILLEQVTRALASPVAGWAADRFGRKPVMMTGLLATALAIPSYALVRGPFTFLALSLAIGAAQAVYGPASSAYIADVTRADRRAGAFGLVHVARNLGWALGIGIGAAITAATTSFVPLFVTGGLAPFAYLWVVALAIREPQRHVAAKAPGNPFRDIATVVRDRALATYLVLASAFFLAWGQFNTVLPLYVVEGLRFPATAVSLVFFLNPTLIVLFQLPFGALGDRVDRWRALAAAGVATAVGYALLAWAGAPGLPALALLAAFSVAFTVGEMLFSPVLSAAAAELAPPGRTGSAMGVLALAAALGHGGAPVLAGFVVDRWGWAWVWPAFAAWTCASVIGLLAFRARFRATVAKRREAARVAASAPG